MFNLTVNLPAEFVICLVLFLVVGVLPGYLIMLMLGFRKPVENIVIGALITFGVFDLYASFLSALNISLSSASFAVFLIILIILSGIVLSKRRGSNMSQPSAGKDAGESLALLLIPSAVMISTLLFFASKIIIPPILLDAYNHCEYVYYIKTTGDINLPQKYPNGFHVINAVSAMLAPLDIPRLLIHQSIFYNSLFPLMIYLFTFFFDKRQKTAFYSALLSVIFFFPYDTYDHGGWTTSLGVLFVGGMLYSLFQAIEKKSVRYYIVVALLFISLMYTHPIDLISIALLAAVYFIIERRKVIGFVTNNYKILAILSFAGFLLVIPTFSNLLQISKGEVIAANEDKINQLAFQTPDTIGKILYFFWHSPFMNNANYLLPFAGLAGLIYLIIKKRHPFFTAGFIIVTAFMFINCIKFLSPLFIRIFPWTFAERIRYLWIYFIPFMSAIFLYDMLEKTGKFRDKIIILIAAVFISMSVPKIYLFLIDSAYKAAPVAESDVAAFKWIRDNLDKDAVILDRSKKDIGEYITILTGRKTASYLFGISPDEKKRDLAYKDILKAQTYIPIMGMPNDARESVKRLNFKYIFSASATAAKERHLFFPKDLLHHPACKLIYSNGRTFLFEYDQRVAFSAPPTKVMDIGTYGDTAFIFQKQFRIRDVWKGLNFSYRWGLPYCGVALPYTEGVKGLRIYYLCGKGQAIKFYFNSKENILEIPPAETDGYRTYDVMFTSFKLKNHLVGFDVEPPLATGADKLGVALDKIELICE